jgi:hypothetical protein
MAIVAALVASTVHVMPAPALAEDGQRRGRDRQEERRYRARYDDGGAVPRAWRSYDYGNPEPGQRGYDAARYYREGYRPVRLGPNDRVYRGSDNRYYCRRDDGTTGLIVGGVAGAVLGNLIAPKGAKALGMIIGGGAGAILGKEVDEGVECK